MRKQRILYVITFILLLLGMMFFSYIPIELFNINYEAFSTTMKLVYMFICDIGYMLILFLIYKDKIINDFKDYFKNFGSNFELSFKYYFIGVIVMIVSNLIISFFITNAIAGNEETVRSMIDQAPLYMIFSVSIYAPFVEELLFRHSIKKCSLCYGDTKSNRLKYIFMSGFIFAALHIIGQVNSYIDYIYIIPYMSLGVAFAALYAKSDNIFSSIMMHALHNTVTIILYFMVGGII